MRRFGITLEKLTSGTELVRYCWTVAEFSVETELQQQQAAQQSLLATLMAADLARYPWIHSR